MQEPEVVSEVEGGISGNIRSLVEEVDEGWRYFWRKRGFIEPPSLVDDQFKFGSLNFEKKTAPKKSKQEETERVPGVQEDRERVP